MTDDTPTTEEVRQGFVFGQPDGSSDARAAEWDTWLADHERKIAAEAWDEGYSAGFTDGDANGRWADDDNPYRADRIEQGGES